MLFSGVENARSAAWQERCHMPDATLPRGLYTVHAWEARLLLQKPPAQVAVRKALTLLPLSLSEGGRPLLRCSQSRRQEDAVCILRYQGELWRLLCPQNRDYRRNYPQKRSFLLAFYHPLWVRGVLISGHNIYTYHIYTYRG